MTQLIGNEYPFFAGYVILQFIVLAVAWSILGGYAGYVNFGTSAFFGMGVYTAVFLFKAFGAPLLVQIAAAAAVGALMGFALGPADPAHAGHLLLDRDDRADDHHRDRDHQLALCRRRGRHPVAAAAGDVRRSTAMSQMLFFVQALLVVLAVAISRYIQNSWIGRGLQALQGRRTRRGMHRRADPAAEGAGLRHLRRADVRGRRARRDVPAIRRPLVRVQSQLLGLGAGDVADRRHRALGGPGRRRHPARRRRSNC